MEGTVCCSPSLLSAELVLVICWIVEMLSASTFFDLRKELRLLREGLSGGQSMPTAWGVWARSQQKVLDLLAAGVAVGPIAVTLFL